MRLPITCKSPNPATQALVPFIWTVLYIDNAFSVFCWFASPPCPHRYLCLVFGACQIFYFMPLYGL
jgi:tryptophan-rich sensory protein